MTRAARGVGQALAYRPWDALHARVRPTVQVASWATCGSLPASVRFHASRREAARMVSEAWSQPHVTNPAGGQDGRGRGGSGGRQDHLPAPLGRGGPSLWRVGRQPAQARVRRTGDAGGLQANQSPSNPSSSSSCSLTCRSRRASRSEAGTGTSPSLAISQPPSSPSRSQRPERR